MEELQGNLRSEEAMGQLMQMLDTCLLQYEHLFSSSEEQSVGKEGLKSGLKEGLLEDISGMKSISKAIPTDGKKHQSISSNRNNNNGNRINGNTIPIVTIDATSTPTPTTSIDHSSGNNNNNNYNYNNHNNNHNNNVRVSSPKTVHFVEDCQETKGDDVIMNRNDTSYLNNSLSLSLKPLFGAWIQSIYSKTMQVIQHEKNVILLERCRHDNEMQAFLGECSSLHRHVADLESMVIELREKDLRPVPAKLDEYRKKVLELENIIEKMSLQSWNSTGEAMAHRVELIKQARDTDDNLFFVLLTLKK